MAKSFSKRYEFVWILIADEKNIVCREQFSKLYEEDRLQSKTKQLGNILTPKTSHRVRVFTQEGVDVKILCDFKSFDRTVRNHIKEIESDPKVMEAHFEEDTVNGYPAIARVTHKLKNESNLIKFIQ